MNVIDSLKINFFFSQLTTIRNYMQWNNKYIYPKSTRSIIQGSRHYSVNQENLPSVTTILKATESDEKKAKLEEWKKKNRLQTSRSYFKRGNFSWKFYARLFRKIFAWKIEYGFTWT